MKRLGLHLLLSVGILSAQSTETPAPQPQPPAQEPSQNSGVPQTLEALGYKLSTRSQTQSASAGCAIPLLRAPIPEGQKFAAKTVPASPNRDPKIVVKPPLPACPENAPVVTKPIVIEPRK
jgi:hypothetical protein